MPYPRSSVALAAILSALVFVASRPAAAQYGGTTGSTTVGAALTPSDFTFSFEQTTDGGKTWPLMNATQAQYFFNRARCECDGDTTNYTGYVKIAIQPASSTDANVRQRLASNLTNTGDARLYVGGSTFNCLQVGVAGVQQNCVNLIDPNNYSAPIPGGITTITSQKVWESQPIPVAWLFNSVVLNNACGAGTGKSCDVTTNCATVSAKQFLYLWADTSGTGVPDSPDIKHEVDLVGNVPLVPTVESAVGGNEALVVNWTWPAGANPSSTSSVFAGVQIFCMRAGQYQVFKDKTFAPGYSASATLCPNIVGKAGSGISQYDPAFLCSDVRPSTESSYRIRRLQNGIDYDVAVAAIDKYNNVSALSDIVSGTPVPTVDFYTEYKDLGGSAQGGYCALAKGRRASGVLAIVGLLVLGLVVRRRRRGGRPGCGPFVVVLLGTALVGGAARAEGIYYDDMAGARDDGSEPWRGSPREFAIELRFGLYTPAVDSEFSGKGVKPQGFIFGNKRRPMWQMEYDWELFQGFGTLALGGVVGYYKENGQACNLEGIDNTKGTCTRSPSDNTSLRLIPLAVLGVYRFDVLAEEWRIPLVPYGKFGFNYTLWSVTDGNGDTPSAGGGKGAGGTAGWQAAVGISLQLDFLDPGAARGFDADAGVNHSYAFFELDTIQSSGLWKSSALHVGDNTWFAGLMFEF